MLDELQASANRSSTHSIASADGHDHHSTN
jgi:hypothetical protein